MEAETGAIRRSLARAAWGIGALLASLLLLLGAVGLWLWAIYLALEGVLPPAGAALVTGVGALIAAGGMVWLGLRMNR